MGIDGFIIDAKTKLIITQKFTTIFKHDYYGTISNSQ